ncbi:Rv0361 family membrane protein [Microtetraspora glauca]|uniref:DUF4878 domain-containing protein n=1 Tax=Microtetraspora glauca TaxID=1996 RepID=A0ABV3G9W4_MICGL
MDPQMEPPDPLFPTRPQRPRRPHRKPLLIAATIITLAVSAAVVHSALSRTHPGATPIRETAEKAGEAQIRTTIEKFAHAVDREDTVTMVAMLCEEEAQSVIDEVPSPDDPGLDPSHERPIDVSDIRVTGDVAKARVTRPAQQPATLYLRKEAGTWKLCDPERHTNPS